METKEMIRVVANRQGAVLVPNAEARVDIIQGREQAAVKLEDCVHEMCPAAALRRHRVTAHRDVLVCSGCGERFYVAHHVTTLGQLQPVRMLHVPREDPDGGRIGD